MLIGSWAAYFLIQSGEDVVWFDTSLASPDYLEAGRHFSGWIICIMDE